MKKKWMCLVLSLFLLLISALPATAIVVSDNADDILLVGDVRIPYGTRCSIEEGERVYEVYYYAE